MHRIISIFLAFMIFYSVAYADDNICFSQATGSKIVVELQQCRITDQQVVILQKENDELVKQIGYLEKIIALQKEELQVSNETIGTMANIVQTEGKACKEATTPSVGKEVKTGLLFTLAGILIGIIIH